MRNPEIIIKPSGPFLAADVGQCPEPECCEGTIWPADGSRLRTCSCLPLRKGCEQFSRARIPLAFHEAVRRPAYEPPDGRLRSELSLIHTAVLATLDPNPTFDPSRAFATITSQPGLGKSWLLAHALRTATIEHGRSGRYVNGRSLLAEMRRLGERGAGKLLDALHDVDVLVLDELGRQRTDFEAGAVAELISGRYDAVKPTWCATNLLLDEQVDIVGDHAVDRLMGAQVFHLRAKSMRQRGRAA